MRLFPLFISVVLLVSGVAQAQVMSVEDRLMSLEQRVKTAEKRATLAESEVLQLKKNITMIPQERLVSGMVPSLTAGDVVNSETTANEKMPEIRLRGYGDLKLYGDVEFNVDAASQSGQLTSLKNRSDGKAWRPGSTERWDVNGRVLIGLDGYRRQDNGRYAGFSVQPLANVNGKMGVDDAAFFFGAEKDWQAKIGRFEAYDLFPLNQDTFVEYSGNTANDLYADGYGYIYMMKEGRGRSSDGGNIMLSKYLGKWYLEVNALFEDGTSLYSEGEYHGNILENKKNAIYVRPVVAWKADAFSAAIGIEHNIISNAYGYTNSSGEWKDQSRRTGYGATLGWNTKNNDPENGVQININTAYMDATDEQDFTIGTNGLWRKFELGYIFAHNEINKFNAEVNNDALSDSLTSPGRYDIHTVHASYLVPNVFDMENFNLYLGGYVSYLQKESKGQLVNGSNDERFGLRARFKYMF
ncbi:carbohydrate porin [Pseudomonas sp. CT11-2]|uniref:carbohydrate porin n=1 Tax=Pseudomonas sp. CT11-2 TaxID=3243023 RepID=UPI0039B0C9F1